MKFIHAADAHIDSPFVGLKKRQPIYGRRFTNQLLPPLKN